MEWISMLVSLVAVAMGWALSQYGKFWEDRKLDKKKLKRLLFFLLELRFQMSRDSAMEKELPKYLKKTLEMLSKDLGTISDDEFNVVKLALINTLKDTLASDYNEKIEYLEKNIDQEILQLAEIYPIFAYELNGQFSIKERQKSLDKYLEEVGDLIKDAPFDLQGWLQPKLSEDFFKEFDENLTRIAGKINKKIEIEIVKKIEIQNGYTYDLNIHKTIEELISNVKTSLQ